VSWPLLWVLLLEKTDVLRVKTVFLKGLILLYQHKGNFDSIAASLRALDQQSGPGVEVTQVLLPLQQDHTSMES